MLRLIDSLEDESAGLRVRLGLDLQLFKLLDYAVQFLFQGPLFLGLLADLLYVFSELVKPQVQNDLQGEFVVRLQLILLR